MKEEEEKLETTRTAYRERERKIFDDVDCRGFSEAIKQYGVNMKEMEGLKYIIERRQKEINKLRQENSRLEKQVNLSCNFWQ